VTDFGIARALTDTGDSRLTATGMAIGTPAYMSPEQARGSVVIVPSADVWSLGCVLYEALTGRKAFAGKTPEAIRAKVLMMAPEAIQESCPEAGDEFARLVHQMLSKDPAERPANGARAAAALRALPRIVSGPRRRVGGPAPATAVMPVRGHKKGASNCFVYFTAPPAAEDEPPPKLESVKQISDRYKLDMHELDDGSVIMRASEQGAAGAVAAARAAIDLKEALFDGAVSVFGQAEDETLGDALDRGAEVQNKAAMENLFAGAMESDGNTIRVDDVIAELICEEIEIEKTETGSILAKRRVGTG